MKDNKILGILGGMGPLATQNFYKILIERTYAQKDQDHIDTIIWGHATLPDRTTAINLGKTAELTRLFLNDIEMLEKMGAATIVIPCNTAHIIVPELQKQTALRIINMIEETATKLASQNLHKKVAILATDGTIKTGLYQNALAKHNIQAYEPSENSQKIIMRMIYDGVKAGNPINFDKFKYVEDELKNEECSSAILACTELSCIPELHIATEFYIDAIEILADAAILECKHQIKTAPLR
ncbi:MAG: aspartate/glutamate racemase family protein [Eubacteriales bacterium]